MKGATIILLMLFSISLGGVEQETKIFMNEELREWGKQQNQNVLKKEFDVNDILPEPDKGKKFDSTALEKHLVSPTSTPEAKEIERFLQKTVKKESLEGTEPFFQMSEIALQSPEKQLDLEIHTKIVPAEEKLETCHETGSYQMSFAQRLEIEVIPEVKEKKKVCGGHRHVDEFFWKKDAEKWVSSQKKLMAKDGSLVWYTAGIGGKSNSIIGNYFVISEWQHKDNEIKCHHEWKETIIQPRLEKDFWQTDWPQGLSAIENNPNCRFLFSQVLEGPSTKTIKNSPVFRDVWARTLLFSCEPNAESPCARLRELGGVLVKRKCLKENLIGDCDLWEKTYDMGGKAAYQKHSYSFKDQEIWGFNGVFDESSEKNTDFSVAAAILGIFADVKKEIEDRGDLTKDHVKVFQGEPFHCACSFLGGDLFDCCKKMEGLAISVYLAKCNSEELALVEKRQAGQCHFVGSKKEILGTQTSKVFCCFPTKLSRVVQEQGRVQLGIEWGKAETPNCRGFSLDEITSLDFSAMDLAEIVEDLAVDKEELLKKVQTTINHLQSSGAKEGEFNTQELLKTQEEKVLHVDQN